jgi:hypothetical protein
LRLGEVKIHTQTLGKLEGARSLDLSADRLKLILMKYDVKVRDVLN